MPGARLAARRRNGPADAARTETRAATSSGAWTAGSQAATMVVNAALSILLARALGATELGLDTDAIALASIGQTVMTGGLNGPAVRVLSSERAADATLTALVLIRDAFALVGPAVVTAVAFLAGGGREGVLTLVAASALVGRALEAPEMWSASVLRHVKADEVFVARLGGDPVSAATTEPVGALGRDPGQDHALGRPVPTHDVDLLTRAGAPAVPDPPARPRLRRRGRVSGPRPHRCRPPRPAVDARRPARPRPPTRPGRTPWTCTTSSRSCAPDGPGSSRPRCWASAPARRSRSPRRLSTRPGPRSSSRCATA
ncbi:lipopolysaccharide biosynthesis protein [Cellulomonas sp. C5510]|uniref:lipopolysaccharide biosynthesis protein n=1 Tax=Cellulomonas sp. C5510 TaxID=2871170 RepID=UPI0021032247|nr:hypothetical protein [Cellulomonas sp. C5510]